MTKSIVAGVYALVAVVAFFACLSKFGGFETHPRVQPLPAHVVHDGPCALGTSC